MKKSLLFAVMALALSVSVEARTPTMNPSIVSDVGVPDDPALAALLEEGVFKDPAPCPYMIE